MKPIHSIRVECRGEKPAAASVAAAVWGNHGTVVGPAGEGWERLCVVSSQDESERVDIRPAAASPASPLILEVSSADRKLAHAAAFFLAMETHGRFL
jgi:hypothetical protein